MSRRHVVRRMNCETMRFRDWIGRAHGQPPAYGLRSTSTISLLTKTSAEGNRRRPAGAARDWTAAGSGVAAWGAQAIYPRHGSPSAASDRDQIGSRDRSAVSLICDQIAIARHACQLLPQPSNSKSESCIPQRRPAGSPKHSCCVV